MRLLSCLTILCAIPLLTACSNNPETVVESNGSSNTDIAVVDINEIARQIGAMEIIQQSMIDLEMELKTKLSQYKSDLDQEYQDRRKEYSDDLNDQAQDELDSLLVKHRGSFSEQSMLAQNQLAAHHNQLKKKLLNQVRPVAYEIANKKGMSVVMTTSQVYAAGPSSDITEAVAKRINELNSGNSAEKQAREGKRVADLPGGGAFLPR